jgi:ABC-2 type transport system ATP-binding protein
LTGSAPTLDLHLTDRPRRASAGFGVAPAEGSRHGVAVASVERLGKRYGRRQAVNGVSFEVNEREVVGLLGPNGSGKTTILRVLTGYLRPSEGTVRIDGFDVVREGHQARARVGYVPENAPLYGHMRVDEFSTSWAGCGACGGRRAEASSPPARGSRSSRSATP